MARVSDQTIAQMTDSLEPRVICDYVALDLRDARALLREAEDELIDPAQGFSKRMQLGKRIRQHLEGHDAAT